LGLSQFAFFCNPVGMNAFGNFLFLCVRMIGAPSQMCTAHTIYGVATLFNTLHVVFDLILEKLLVGDSFYSNLLYLDLT
jgi:hypothetical protein